MTILDYELIEEIDFSLDAVCEAYNGTCDRKAEWRAKIVCCGQLVLSCDKCVKAHIDWLKTVAPNSFTHGCGYGPGVDPVRITRL